MPCNGDGRSVLKRMRSYLTGPQARAAPVPISDLRKDPEQTAQVYHKTRALSIAYVGH